MRKLGLRGQGVLQAAEALSGGCIRLQQVFIGQVWGLGFRV